MRNWKKIVARQPIRLNRNLIRRAFRRLIDLAKGGPCHERGIHVRMRYRLAEDRR